MPLIYHAQCTTCGKGPEAGVSLVGWIAKELPEGGKTFVDTYSALKLDGGKFIGLPHPMEFRTPQYGFTVDKASKEERLCAVGFKICSQCGLVHEEVHQSGGLEAAPAAAGRCLRLFQKPYAIHCRVPSARPER